MRWTCAFVVLFIFHLATLTIWMDLWWFGIDYSQITLSLALSFYKSEIKKIIKYYILSVSEQQKMTYSLFLAAVIRLYSSDYHRIHRFYEEVWSKLIGHVFALLSRATQASTSTISPRLLKHQLTVHNSCLSCPLDWFQHFPMKVFLFIENKFKIEFSWFSV